MTAGQLKIVGGVLVMISLMGLGAGAGVWLAARHYRPLLDSANGKTTTCARSRFLRNSSCFDL